MKAIILVIGLVGLLAQAALAQFSGISLDVKEVATAKQVNRNWGSVYTSNSTTNARSKVLNVSTRNLSRKPLGDAEIVAFWMVKNAGGGSAVVQHFERRKAQMNAMGNCSEDFTSPVVTSTTTNWYYSNGRTEYGLRPAGWIVVLRNPEGILAAKAMGSESEAILRDNQKLTALLDQHAPQQPAEQE